jgi:plasmid maintenance system antidote protein VapI
MPPTITLDTIYTATEAAERLRVTRRTVGDVIATKLDRTLDTVMVCERYFVQGFGGDAWWHIIIRPVRIAAGRGWMLRKG